MSLRSKIKKNVDDRCERQFQLTDDLTLKTSSCGVNSKNGAKKVQTKSTKSSKGSNSHENCTKTGSSYINYEVVKTKQTGKPKGKEVDLSKFKADVNDLTSQLSHLGIVSPPFTRSQLKAKTDENYSYSLKYLIKGEHKGSVNVIEDFEGPAVKNIKTAAQRSVSIHESKNCVPLGNVMSFRSGGNYEAVKEDTENVCKSKSQKGKKCLKTKDKFAQEVGAIQTMNKNMEELEMKMNSPLTRTQYRVRKRVKENVERCIASECGAAIPIDDLTTRTPSKDDPKIEKKDIFVRKVVSKVWEKASENLDAMIHLEIESRRPFGENLGTQGQKQSTLPQDDIVKEKARPQRRTCKEIKGKEAVSMDSNKSRRAQKQRAAELIPHIL